MASSNPLRSFFSGIGRVFAFLRVTLANLFVLLLIVVVVVALMSAPDRPAVEDGAALVLKPKGVIVEQTSFGTLLTLSAPTLDETALGELLRAIDTAADDDRLNALVLDLSELTYVAPAHLGVIGNALEAFRDSGKRIVARSTNYGRDQYYLASFADDIYLHPLGDVMLGGYGLFESYFQGLLESLKIKVHVFRVGSYKAAVEPYTRTDMSPDAKAANQAVVDHLWQSYIERVAANRDMSSEQLLAYANSFDRVLAEAGGDTARAALEAGLVDAVLTDEQATARLRALTGGGDGVYRSIAAGSYLLPRTPPLFGDKVAVVTASGPILMGSQPRGFIGAESLTRLLRTARSDASIKAVVLRIDSGGGSALASELIRGALEQLQQAGKPVVASMSSVAASGGYWIAATADEIWAAPTTLTGSIGIFAILPTMEDSLGAAGVTRDGVATGPFVAAADPLGGLGEAMGRALQANVEFGYRSFLEVVARGRDLTPEAVDAVGQGRVWTGEQARAHGLVDHLGHLDDAVESAASLAGVDNYGVLLLEEEPTLQEALIRQLMEAAMPSPPGVGNRLAADLARNLSALGALNDPKHLYALCTACGGDL